MPTLWRYTLRNYLQVLLLCVAGFISVLLVTRFQTIARFAATGASKLFVLKFVLFQIPFILPLAIPISCLIASLLFFQRLSRTHELTALRSAGLGILPIAYPILACGALIAVANFAIVSEIAPRCRAYSKSLAYQMTAINPLCLLQKDTLIKLKDSYVDMKVLKSGKYAKDVIFIMRNQSNERLGMTIAKKVFIENETLSGRDVTFISTIDPKKSECFDHLVIENQEEMETRANELAQYLRSSDWNINYDYLNLRMVQAKYAKEKGKGTKLNHKALQEVARRSSVGLAAFTLSLIGVAFGMELSRGKKVKGTLWAVGLAALYLVCFVAGKSIRHDITMSILFFILPHPVIVYFCARAFKRVSRGAE